MIQKQIPTMKTFEKTIRYLCIMLFFFTSICEAQESGQRIPAQDEILTAAKKIISEAQTCSLITLDKNDVPMIRLMDPFEPDGDFTIWFGTNSQSRKVDQIRNNPEVGLYYLENDDSGYVVIHGRAELVDDIEEKARRWKEEWTAFYPEKSKDYLLIKVIPKWMEVLSPTRGINADPKTWKAPVFNFDNKI
jgi:general stress protein 26